jgi:2-polyprenyl-3-methyl-5-hydroxy-6-metoxy-1,4-benzoquinol methylase
MDLAKIGAALLRMDTDKIAKGLKRRWLERTFAYETHHRDEVARFDRLYLMPDPWAMRCERENFRFSETNRLIRENFDHPRTLLEIGCGEGLQSNRLQQVCDHLYGIDVSKRAVARAIRHCPQATFAVCDMYSAPKFISSARYDVVTACEVLYYMPDVAGALRRISELGQACLISYYDGAHDLLDTHVRQLSGVNIEIVSHEEVTWTLAWWRP